MTAPAPTLSADDLAAVAAAVQSFAAQEIAPRCARPERPPSPGEVEQVACAAREFGLLASDPDEPASLWERLDASGVALSTASLATLAGESPGIAWHLHTLALGAALERALGRAPSTSAVAALELAGGLGRGPLGALLAGERLTPAARDLLGEQLAGGRGGCGVQAAEGWERLLAPRLSPGGAVEWLVFDRAALTLEPQHGAHGLDETVAWRVTLPDPLPPALAASPAEGAAALALGLGLNALGALAVGLGSARSALRRARTYAGQRVQGGRAIAGHPAVQLLLGAAEANVTAVAALLEAAGPAPRGLAALRRALALAAAGHPLLCAAATDALQVLGGYGYMRDYGVEAALRANQHLRLLATTPRDVHLFLGGGEAP